MAVPVVADVVLDSGARETYATGARRDTRAGKGRYDLISPLAIKRLALVFERGAAKYGDRNFELGIKVSRYLDSALRHAFEYLEGKRDEDHLAQATWNLMAALHTEEAVIRRLLPEELYDVPDYTERPAVTAAVPSGPDAPDR